MPYRFDEGVGIIVIECRMCSELLNVLNSYLVAPGFFQQVMFFDSKKPYVLFRTGATGTSVRKFVGIDANIESVTEKFPRCGERSQWAHRICHFTQRALFRQQF